MAQSHEHIGPKISAKIKIYILSRAKLLCSLCYEIPCTMQRMLIKLAKKKTNMHFLRD